MDFNVGDTFVCGGEKGVVIDAKWPVPGGFDVVVKWDTTHPDKTVFYDPKTLERWVRNRKTDEGVPFARA